MPLLKLTASTLLLIDLQARLVPAIADGAAMVANAVRLMAAAGRLGVPVVVTEQYPKGLGQTVPELTFERALVLGKMSFDATPTPGFLAQLPSGHDLVVAGCETHVCVLQTVVSLLEAGRRVVVVEDAVGSRQPASKAAGLARLARHGADIVTTEMVLFEWLRTAEHPRFHEVVGLIK